MMRLGVEIRGVRESELEKMIDLSLRSIPASGVSVCPRMYGEAGVIASIRRESWWSMDRSSPHFAFETAPYALNRAQFLWVGLAMLVPIPIIALWPMPPL